MNNTSLDDEFCVNLRKKNNKLKLNKISDRHGIDLTQTVNADRQTDNYNSNNLLRTII